jgi:hypothetical protein
LSFVSSSTFSSLLHHFNYKFVDSFKCFISANSLPIILNHHPSSWIIIDHCSLTIMWISDFQFNSIIKSQCHFHCHFVILSFRHTLISSHSHTVAVWLPNHSVMIKSINISF